MIEINKSIEYTFLEAWEKAIDNKNIIITSKNSEFNYKIDISNKQNKLKFLNPVIGSWQSCTYVTLEEIFDEWYVTIK
ncbi:hypothetical protein [uncultured Clostridium sp.]|uniref:hypothetical protein n=1 Tax=uncultured Clostridium sp. TaxID=59620 RepID=UPI0028ECC651|nr:hypothetical protein [uncultured Clostridium sp.]